MERNNCNQTLTPIPISDEEHALILMFRTMPLNEIIHVMMLNTHFPVELCDKYDHIRNIINLKFEKTHQTHTIKTIIEFISTQPSYSCMFEHFDLHSMIEQYQNEQVIDSTNACEFYLKPYTNECVQCKKRLNLKYNHRPKTVMSSTKNYKARGYQYDICW